jgi:hypothetical protein
MTARIAVERIDSALAEMLAQELGKAKIPIALVHEEGCDFFYAESVRRTRHSSLRMAVPQTWLRGEEHRRNLRAAARLFRRHVGRHLYPEN